MQPPPPLVIAPAVCSLLCALLGVVALLEQRRYTPIYEAVWCTPASTELGSVQLSPLSVVVTVDLVCTNPNPYDIIAFPTEVGIVYLGESLRDVGRLTSERTVVPAASGDGIAEAAIPLHAEVRLGLFETLAISNQILQGAFTIYFNLNLMVLIKPSLMLMSPATIEIPVSEHCGMQIQLLPAQAIGDAICSSHSFNLLEVPDLEVSSPDSRGITPAVSNETLSGAEGTRDSFCGALMSVGFGCGCLFALMFMASLFMRRRPITPAQSPRALETNVANAVPIGASACSNELSEEVESIVPPE